MLRRCLRRCHGDATPSFAEAYASSGSSIKGGKNRQLTSVQIGVSRDVTGALHSALQPFADRGLSLSHIQSRKLPFESKAKFVSLFFNVDVLETEPRLQDALADLKKMHLPLVQVLGSWDTPWYPTHAKDLDLLDQKTLAAGADLVDDPMNPHPGFHDQAYRDRRKLIVENAANYKFGEPIPEAPYTAEEHATWTAVWDKLTGLYPTHACQQHNRVFPLLIENAGYCREKIPQLETVSNFLKEATGFTIRPVTGLLSSRDFFAALAFKVFFSTQYIRHHSRPLYTPEPDVVHELMGHAPLFADKAFADFSQQFGLLSLGASDEVIEMLSRCYWYTVEFGLCKEGGQTRAFGAGLLSSFGELEYCKSGKPQLLPWDPFVAGKLAFPITTYQPTYFVAESFEGAQDKLREFGKTIDRPFEVEYNVASGHVRTWAKHPL